jgi:ribosomal peptide maturation radical SAM protein 1
MPFANFMAPSLALTQLKSAVLSQTYSSAVSVDLVYANQDFAKYLGFEAYEFISGSMQALYAGLGDWLFRGVAFPALADNRPEYLGRFFWKKTQESALVASMLEHKSLHIQRYLEEIIDAYSLDTADIVGFSSMFMQNVASFALARLLKKRNPQIITVIGGANCEFPMGQVIADKIRDIDYVFSGPSLISLPSFIQCYLDDSLQKAVQIPGIFVSSKSYPLRNAATIGQELDINTPIELNYQEFYEKLSTLAIAPKEKPIYPFETSRGCWWGQRAHCTFCGLNGESMAYRSMSPERAVDQFSEMFSHADKYAVFQSVDNILPKNYLTDVLPRLSPPNNVMIFYEVKADLSEDQLLVLKRAGVRLIQPGIESLATSTLKLMRKGTTAPQNIRFLKHCTLYGISPAWNLLVGFPGEGADVYRRYLEVLPLLAHLRPPSGVFPVRFDRFSPYHRNSKDYALDLAPMDFYSLVYPFETNALKSFAYYFSDRNVLAEYSVAVAKWLPKLEKAVSQWKARWTPGNGELAPTLHFRRDTESVCDTRSGRLVEHHVGRLGIEVLDYLARGVNREEVLKTFSAASGNKITTIIADIQERGLLFEEGDRLLSLVLEGQPEA